MHWDWDHHHEHYWHWKRTWPWSLGNYHLKCPTRRFMWDVCNSDFDVCGRDWPFYGGSDMAPWCHRSCLASKVYIESGDETDSNGKGTFKVVIDVHHFRADELSVRVKNNDKLLLDGKQKDDRADKSGLCITREFSRKYRLPRHYDATQAKVTLSTDGILTIMVPAPPPLDDVERTLEIVQTGAYFGSASSAASKSDAMAIEGAQSAGSTNGEDSEK